MPKKATLDAKLVAEKQALEARVSSLEKRLSEVLSRIEGTDGPQSVRSSTDTAVVNEKEVKPSTSPTGFSVSLLQNFT